MDISISQYLRETRDPYANAILVLPMFIAYQIGILATGGVRNGVDFMTEYLFMLAGHDFGVYVAINFGLCLLLAAALALLRDNGSFRMGIWPGVLLESTVYGALLGSAVLFVMRNLGLGQILATGAAAELNLFDKLVLSIGAGLYEELVFRLLLTGGLFYLVRRTLDWSSWAAALFAVLASSVAFSGVHYIGSMADPFTFQSFMFRYIAGVLLAAIFYLRGFAIAVYTHAIYDIFVLVL